MRLLDIHSHILPALDDGARDLECSVALLEEMKVQGISDVLATPHFDASQYNLEEFEELRQEAKTALDERIKDLELPKVYLGCEVYYFPGISKIGGIKRLCLNDSNYILLELRYGHSISDSIIAEIANLYKRSGIIPIIAHIERYTKEKGFKKLLDLIKNRMCLAQVNATSLCPKNPYKKAAIKLMKKGYVSFVATDAHSIEARPPLMQLALKTVREELGEEYERNILENFDFFYKEVMLIKNNLPKDTEISSF